MRNQNNKRNKFASHKTRKPSICTTKKYLQNYVPQQRMAPGIASYAIETKSKNEKACIIGDSHLTLSRWRSISYRNQLQINGLVSI